MYCISIGQCCFIPFSLHTLKHFKKKNWVILHTTFCSLFSVSNISWMYSCHEIYDMALSLIICNISLYSMSLLINPIPCCWTFRLLPFLTNYILSMNILVTIPLGLSLIMLLGFISGRQLAQPQTCYWCLSKLPYRKMALFHTYSSSLWECLFHPIFSNTS